MCSNLKERYSRLPKLKLKNFNSFVPQNYDDFVELFQTDLWNLIIYQRILEKRYSNQISFIEIETEHAFHKYTNVRHTFKEKVLNYFDSVISLFGGKKEVLFYKSYLPPKKLIITLITKI